ncbi:unnamed protein product [Paramecium pentaurelia]|uniref:Uncharacterized protein n=1 Tax=Paramecium pentaurelia TaxID=43138 RepID=A0A8S1V606_9CILI|nr:unnamed protein product [Paramecium pentaurelia]
MTQICQKDQLYINKFYIGIHFNKEFLEAFRMSLSQILKDSLLSHFIYSMDQNFLQMVYLFIQLKKMSQFPNQPKVIIIYILMEKNSYMKEQIIIKIHQQQVRNAQDQIKAYCGFLNYYVAVHKCQPNCLQCLNETTCTQWSSDFVENVVKFSQEELLINYYYDNDSYDCLDCPLSCLTCTCKMVCSTCQSTFGDYLVVGQEQYDGGNQVDTNGCQNCKYFCRIGCSSCKYATYTFLN